MATLGLSFRGWANSWLAAPDNEYRSEDTSDHKTSGPSEKTHDFHLS